MSKKKTITVVALLENDPITGVKYGEKEITSDEQTTLRPEDIKKYLAYKTRNKEIIRKNHTMQK